MALPNTRIIRKEQTMALSIVSWLQQWRRPPLSCAQDAPPVTGQPFPDSPPLDLPIQALPLFVQESAVAMRYYHLFSPIRWHRFPERDLHQYRYRPPVPYAPFAATCLIKLEETQPSFAKLRRYLVEHPPLLWLLGFPIVPSPNFRWGFDADASLPTARHLTSMLRTLPNPVLQFLLDETVSRLHEALRPYVQGFGQVISLDTKHILAWVQENNPKTFVENRYDKDQQPAGDPDCRLGCKRKRNQQSAQQPGEAPPTPTHELRPATGTSVGEYYWGYASGVVVTKIPGWAEIVLAELTQPFNAADVSYFSPLMTDTERRLGFRPRYGTFDAAFDAWYVYEHFHRDQKPWTYAFAAIPWAKRGPKREFDAQGLPLCKAGLPMPLKSTFICKTRRVHHERGRYGCPLLHPQPSADACPIHDKHWEKGGCTITMPTSIGARIRHQIDRESRLYKTLYNQRSATERINSQAKALGIERPKLRNGAAIANLNTLIYVLINLRALTRIQAKIADM